ncbi:MAG: carbonic anhydrase [Campylobacter sp.]|nr:carbonic anhydrase [Campylobacter sp.]
MDQKLLLGAIKFMKEDFFEHKELFESLANKQKPHTLFIGCADSRVVPNLITNTKPGELFVVRNIANIVPAYRISEDFVSTTAAIEYALYALNIKNIIVCGHTNCGGCEALYADENKLNKVPNVKKWLNLLDDIKTEISKMKFDDKREKFYLTERLNIINSIDNLMTYPHLDEWVQKGQMQIYGWHYDIQKGLLYNYDRFSKHFVLLEKGIDYEKIYKEIFCDY